MKKSSVLFLFAFIATLVVSAFGAPINEEFGEAEEADHVIVKRATCDLLSFEIAGIKFNDSACAAHCLSMGKGGGHCNGNGVCVCRK